MDGYMNLALLAGIVLVIAGAVLLHEWSNRRRATRLLRTRSPLDPLAFGRMYLGESEGRARLAAEVREVLAEHVPYTLEGLGPDDTFVQDLRMDELDSLSTVELIANLEQRFSIKIPDEDAQHILTFRQLVDYLESRVSQWRLGPGSDGAGEQGVAADEAR